MGYSRNFGLRHSRGDYVLFLDDDTVIMQDDFLKKMATYFDSQPQVSAVMPHGEASYAFMVDRYDFHDPFFMTSRCTAYRREVLAALGGFISSFIGQEDVEFVVRFNAAGYRAVAVPDLAYRHPPLCVPDLGKPMAVGLSFYGIRKRYPLLMWLLVVINCSRHLPLVVAPTRKHREMGRFALGFLCGVLSSPFRSGGLNYR
jgi:cellulose synthase/poly-beta-1,6-N-acetylglucosamine synthase-like glycosyltransferase